MSAKKPTACSRARVDKMDNHAHDQPASNAGEEGKNFAHQLHAAFSIWRDSAEP